MLGSARRADLFARALDGEAVDDAATLRLLGVTSQLTAMQVAVPARQAATRTALVGAAGIAIAETARQGAGTTLVHTAATSVAKAGLFHGLTQSMALATATGLAAVAVGAGAVGVAAHRSIPGDPLYGVKRTSESARLALARSDTDKAHVRLSEARTRLSEVHDLWPSQPSDEHTAQIATLVRSLDEDVALATPPLLNAGGDAARQLLTTATHLQTTLASFPRTVIGAGMLAVDRSIALLGTLSATVTAMPSIVPGAGPTSTAPTAPTQSVQVVPPLAGLVAPSTAPTPAPAGSATSQGAAPTGVAPVLPTTVPSLPPLLPSTLPSVVASTLPSAVGSVVCGLLGIVGGSCPAGQ